MPELPSHAPSRLPDCQVSSLPSATAEQAAHPPSRSRAWHALHARANLRIARGRVQQPLVRSAQRAVRTFVVTVAFARSFREQYVLDLVLHRLWIIDRTLAQSLYEVLKAQPLTLDVRSNLHASALVLGRQLRPLPPQRLARSKLGASGSDVGAFGALRELLQQVKRAKSSCPRLRCSRGCSMAAHRSQGSTRHAGNLSTIVEAVPKCRRAFAQRCELVASVASCLQQLCGLQAG